MIRNIHMKHPKFHHFWISRDSDVINVISRIVRNQLRLSGMFLVVSETATHASRLQSTVQIALRRNSGRFSAHHDVGRAATVAQTVDSQSTVCAERAR